MSDQTHIPEDEDPGRVAEHALHLDEGADRAAFAARAEREPALGLELASWHERLAPLSAAFPEVPPPAEVWAGVRARLFADDQARTRPGGLSGLLRGVFAGGIVAALILLLALFTLDNTAPPEPGGGPVLTAEIASEDSELLVRASFTPDADSLTVERVAGSAAPGRVLQLWLIAGEEPPQSLGVLPDEATAEVALAAPLPAGGVLAISDEPPGGSPDPGPSGAVLATGTIPAP